MNGPLSRSTREFPYFMAHPTAAAADPLTIEENDALTAQAAAEREAEYRVDIGLDGRTRAVVALLTGILVVIGLLIVTEGYLWNGG
jgi:hypothetical protein